MALAKGSLFIEPLIENQTERNRLGSRLAEHWRLELHGETDRAGPLGKNDFVVEVR